MGDKKKNPSFVLQSAKKVEYQERDRPRIHNPHDVIVQVAYTGICGSDVHYWHDGQLGDWKLEDPMVLGHESSGVVVETGSAITTLKPGDHVAMEPGEPCYHCEHCKSGNYHLCPAMKFASTPPFDGTLAKYYILPGDFCYKLPANVGLREAALVEPTAVAVHVVRQGEVRPGHRVAVYGAGPVGLLCAGVARGFGARDIAVIDISQERLDFARSWVPGGCHIYLPSKDLDGVANADRLKEQLGWDGADVVLEATGAEACMQQGLWLLRRGGTFVQAGMGKSMANVPIANICRGEIQLRGSFRYKQGDYAMAVDLIDRAVVDVKPLISQTVPFEQAEQAFQDAHAGKGIKIVIEGVKT